MGGGNFGKYLLDRLETLLLVFLQATVDNLAIASRQMVFADELEHTSDGIYIGACIHIAAVAQLFGCGIAVGVTDGERARIGVAASQVDEPHVAVGGGEQDVRWLQVQVECLVLVHLLQGQAQLAQESVQMGFATEVERIVLEELGQILPVDVFHQEVTLVGRLRQAGVVHHVVGVQLAAQLVLLAHHLAIELLVEVFGTQRFHEIVASVDAYLIIYLCASFLLQANLFAEARPLVCEAEE